MRTRDLRESKPANTIGERETLGRNSERERERERAGDPHREKERQPVKSSVWREQAETLPATAKDERLDTLLKSCTWNLFILLMVFKETGGFSSSPPLWVISGKWQDLGHIPCGTGEDLWRNILFVGRCGWIVTDVFHWGHHASRKRGKKLIFEISRRLKVCFVKRNNGMFFFFFESGFSSCQTDMRVWRKIKKVEGKLLTRGHVRSNHHPCLSAAHSASHVLG